MKKTKIFMVDLPKGFPHIIGYPYLNIACKKTYEEFQKVRENPRASETMIKKYKKQMHDMIDLF
ncbi:MAG: hypothetical protein ACTSWY_13925 [Promethearchaeota archaeon]